MKKSTLIATALVLPLLSLTVGAAPPGGTGRQQVGHARSDAQKHVEPL